MKKRELENNREKSPRVSKKVVERPAKEHVSQETSAPDLGPCIRTTMLPGEAVSPQTHATLLNRAKAAGVTQANRVLRHLQRQYGNLYVQRVVDLAGKGEEKPDVAPEVEQAIQSKRGSGQDLDKGVRSQMESAMGADFSGVRVHTDAEADTLNRHLNARAFTTGQDIFFREGNYKPGSLTGRELLAHELTHVVQQTDGLRKKMTLGQSDDKYEQEADEVARSVMKQEQQAVQKKEKILTKASNGQLGDRCGVPWLANKVTRRQQKRIVQETIQRASTRVGRITWYSTRAEAEAAVPTHVSPRACFVWHGGGPSGYPWRVIPGTGCAHWVAHEKGINGTPGCYQGNAIRVSQVISGLSQHNLQNAQVDDIWTNTARSHTGIVRAVNRNRAGTVTSVSVEHCSSGSGGVVTSTFSSGRFYR